MERAHNARDAGTRKRRGTCRRHGCEAEILPYARDAGRGASGEDQLAELADANAIHGAMPRERRPWWTESWITSRRRYWVLLQLALSNIKRFEFENPEKG